MIRCMKDEMPHIVMYLRSRMTPRLRFSLPMPFWFYPEKLTDSRLESILKKADGKLAHLSIKLHKYYDDYELIYHRLFGKAPLSPSIMQVILNASREKRLDHLNLHGCLEVRSIWLDFEKFHFHMSLLWFKSSFYKNKSIFRCVMDASIWTCMTHNTKR